MHSAIAAMTGGAIQVLVAEDSDTAAELITAILEADPAIRVIGRAADGVEAVRLTKKLRPDLVLIDVQMPRMNGLMATKTIMMECPTPIVIISAWLDSNELNVSMEALRMGAVAVLEKPVGPTAPSFEKLCAELTDAVKAMAGIKTVRHWPARSSERSMRSRTCAAQGGSVRVVTIAASTGGPQAVAKLLAPLPASFPAPILIVQHIGAQFMSGLAQWLGSCTELQVKVADPGEQVRKGSVYFPAEDRHLVVRRGGKLELSKSPPVSGFRPSANVLFESAAAAYGSAVLAVILTGMGSDGTVGACSIKAAGGTVIAQDKATSVVFGMPKAAIENGCVTQTMSLGEIGSRLSHLTTASQPRT